MKVLKILSILLFLAAMPLCAQVSQPCPTATTAKQGCVKPDGTSITVTNGTISATGGSGSGTVNSGTAGQAAYYPATAAAVSSTPAVTVTAGVPTLASGALATTASANDNSTKVATTAYADRAVANGPAVPTCASITGGVPARGTCSFTLTAAQLKALQATPITVIAAQGANTIIVVNPNSGLEFVCNACTPYTIGTGDFISLYYNDIGVDAFIAIPPTDFIDQSVSQFTVASPTGGAAFYGSTTIAVKSDYTNVSLKIGNAGAGEYTVGTGTLLGLLNYNIITLN